MLHTNGKRQSLKDRDLNPDVIDRVYSVTINGKNDCVVMTREEASLVILKFDGAVDSFEMYDMTARHGLLPEFLHKEFRMMDILPDNVTWTGEKPPTQTYVKGIGPGMWGGAAKMVWEFDDLIGDTYFDLTNGAGSDDYGRKMPTH